MNLPPVLTVVGVLLRWLFTGQSRHRQMNVSRIMTGSARRTGKLLQNPQRLLLAAIRHEQMIMIEA